MNEVFNAYKTDSKLAVLFLQSPNYSKRPEEVKPDKIVITVSPYNNVMDAADELCISRRCRSSHYVVGCDGKVVQLVKECARAWATNSRKVDNVSISIFVCSGGFPDWIVTDKAVESLGHLIGDICKRKKLDPTECISPYFCGASLLPQIPAAVAIAVSDISKRKKKKESEA